MKPTNTNIKKGKPLLAIVLVFVMVPPLMASEEPRSFNEEDKLKKKKPVLEKKAENLQTINTVSLIAEKFFLEEATENDIFLEDWMLDTSHKFWESTFEEDSKEEEIELEEWMTDLSEWKIEK